MILNNSEIARQTISEGRLQSVTRSFDLKAEIIPCIEVSSVNTRTNYFLSGGQTTTGTITMTLPSGRRFWLKTIVASYCKDATCDIASGSTNVQVTVGGATKTVIAFPMLTTTAQIDRCVLSLPSPILLDVGSNVIFLGTFTAGALIRNLQISGYLEDIGS